MYFAITGVLAGFAAYRWGDWRNWKQYYPTILFAVMGNMTSELLMYRSPLWEYNDVFGDYMVLLIGLSVLLFSGTVILFLSFYPKKPAHQALFILAWAVGFTALEYLAMQAGSFLHHRGWSIWYTLLHNLIMFALFRLHFKRPLLAWPASFLVAFAVLWYFDLPFELVR